MPVFTLTEYHYSDIEDQGWRSARDIMNSTNTYSFDVTGESADFVAQEHADRLKHPSDDNQADMLLISWKEDDIEFQRHYELMLQVSYKELSSFNEPFSGWDI